MQPGVPIHRSSVQNPLATSYSHYTCLINLLCTWYCANLMLPHIIECLLEMVDGTRLIQSVETFALEAEAPKILKTSQRCCLLHLHQQPAQVGMGSNVGNSHY